MSDLRKETELELVTYIDKHYDNIVNVKEHIKDFQKHWREFRKTVLGIAKEEKIYTELINLYLEGRKLKVLDIYLVNFARQIETYFTEAEIKKDMNIYWKTMWN